MSGSSCLAQGAGGCGNLQNGYGPFDYRSDRDKLGIVDMHHFTPEVELLLRGKSGTLGGDLDYTLRAFPNHHRALVAMTRLAERDKTDKPAGANYTVACYYDRAIRLAPDDTVARGLYAAYLNKTSKRAEAAAQLEAAAEAAADNGFAHYNIGLVYLEMKEHGKALAQAHRALRLGFTRPVLIDALKRVGVWKEPPPIEDEGADPAPASASAPAAAPASIAASGSRAEPAKP